MAPPGSHWHVLDTKNCVSRPKQKQYNLTHCDVLLKAGTVQVYSWTTGCKWSSAARSRNQTAPWLFPKFGRCKKIGTANSIREHGPVFAVLVRQYCQFFGQNACCWFSPFQSPLEVGLLAQDRPQKVEHNGTGFGGGVRVAHSRKKNTRVFI